ncbi:PEP-CTERM system TPR-repeat protein PrsT [Paucibacter sp. B2R-40]|uniref:XrtA/PEP-CTERM system TPR-repeat protein PrsT n=1 Tax=Paucibacter sp. B2R-40 TaxID=2893554 RepID=UPI0021E3C656|nr:XrtA/PEP-CTERM system TPR-repeat protein PrsT [Paucibacter sp. B2R-40]MCV2355621.1 PEP-CTERM system TPR-repeat protein PrsT [Paucibacter sp. B2R-40]
MSSKPSTCTSTAAAVAVACFTWSKGGRWFKSNFSPLFLLTLMLLGGCGQSSDDSSAGLLVSAKSYIERKDPKAAVIQLKRLLQKNPELAEARFLLGQILLNNGDAAVAEVELRKALELKHPRDLTLPPLARAMLMQGASLRVIESYASTELTQPTASADLQTSLAKAYFNKGDRLRGEAALTAALKLAPRHAPARMLQAHHLAANGQNEAALAVVAELIKSVQEDADAWLLQGELLATTQAVASQVAVAKAIESFQQALRLKADLVGAHTGIISTRMAQQDYAAAQTAFKAMAKVLPAHRQTLHYEALLALHNGDLRGAQQLADKVLSTEPSNPTSMQLAGTVALQAGNLNKAAALFANALQITPGNPVLRRLLARSYLRSSQPALALATLQPLLLKGDADAELLTLSGLAHQQSGQPQQAKKLFAAAAKLKPDDSRLRGVLAYSRLGEGEDEASQAIKDLQVLAAADKAGGESDQALITALLQRRKFETALRALDALEKKQPDKALASLLRGQLALARGDIAAARTNFERAIVIAPSDFPAYAALAALDLQDQDVDHARKRFEALLKHDAQSPRALVALAGFRARDSGSKEDVNKLLAGAVSADPTKPETRLLLINQHLQNQDLKLALAAAQDGVAALPNEAIMIDALGRVQLAARDFNQAAVAFKQLAALQAKSPLPLMSLAQVSVAMKDLPAAINHLNRALALRPGFLPAMQGLIDLQLASGHAEQALKLAREIQKLQPQEAVGYAAEAAVQTNLKQWDAAAATYRMALLRAKFANGLAIKLHTVLVAGGKTSEAEKFAADWLKSYPQDGFFLLYLGELAMTRQDYPSAETRLLEVARLDPDNAAVQNNLAWVLMQLKKPGAAAHAEKANSLRPKQPAFLDTWAQALAEEKQFAKAVAVQAQALELQPDNPIIKLSLARLYLKAGNKPMAKAQLDQLAALGNLFAGQNQVDELRKSL